jgi:hypothetical protein
LPSASGPRTIDSVDVAEIVAPGDLHLRAIAVMRGGEAE